MSSQNQIIRVGIGVIVQDTQGRILLGKRNKATKRVDSKLNHDWDWSLPGGGLEYGEEFEECAIREVKEETNLDIHNPIFLCVHNDKDERAHWITIGMLATKYSGMIALNEPDKFTEWKWFPLDALPKDIFSPSMKNIAKYIKNMVK